jgi:hypothetical protein
MATGIYIISPILPRSAEVDVTFAIMLVIKNYLEIKVNMLVISPPIEEVATSQKKLLSQAISLHIVATFVFISTTSIPIWNK